MKKLISMFLLMSVVLALQGCKDKDDGADMNDVPQNDVPRVKADEEQNYLNIRAIYSDSHKIEVSEAREIAENSAESFFGSSNGSGLRSSNLRVVAETVALTKEATGLRSSSDEFDLLPDTLAYVLNYADSMGFAIIAADDRVGDILLACTDNGAIEDEIDNPGLAIFLENVEEYVKNSIIEFEQMKDSLEVEAELQTGVPVYSNDGLRSSKKNKTKKVTMWDSSCDEVYIPYMIETTWKQGFPFNAKVSNKKVCSENEYVPAGCVAVAMGQLMAYWKQPTIIENHYYDWKNIIESSPYYIGDYSYFDYNEDVSALMEVIGRNVGMNYGCGGSGVDAEKALQYLKKFGYSVSSSKDYSISTVYSSLKKKCPLVIRGYAGKKTVLGIPVKYTDGHCWLIDGYASFYDVYKTYEVDTKTDKILKCVSTSKTKRTYIHNNWGYGGHADGWFADGCFNMKKAMSYTSTETDDKRNFFDFQYKKLF